MNLKSTTSMDRINKLSLLGTTALIMSLGFVPMAYAQDTLPDTVVTDDEDVIVATGIRQSLKEARDLKRNADTAIDSITASDVGALPDLSVAEALARVPGVVVQRFDITNNNGGDFPSPEGGGNLIRGLTLVRSEFNGRDAFSANGGRALDFGTIPPELIGAVDVYKNTSADLIEGGIGGTINLRTLEPFDQDGLLAVVNVDGTYTDLREEFSPEYSVIVGNRWETGAGEFGLLGSFSSSELKSELNGFQIGQVVSLATDDGTIAVPSGFQLRTNDVDRERDSYYVAGQWRDNSGDLLVTAKYSLIENDTQSDERTLEFFADGESFSQVELAPGFTTRPFTSSGLPACQGGNPPNGDPLACEVTTAVDGIFEEGVISNNLRDWTGAAGAPFTNLGIAQREESQTDDLSLNIKWNATDRLFVNLDAHKTTAESTRQRVWGGTRFFADFNLNADIDNPSVAVIPNADNNPNLRTGEGVDGAVASSNLDESYLLFAADEFFDNEGELYALQGDIEYEFGGDGWFDSVKFGARYADREQTNRSAGLNWASVAAPWQGGYLPVSSLQQPATDAVDFSGFFRGGVVQGTNTTFNFVSRDLLNDYDAYSNFIASDPAITDASINRNPDWNPLRNADGVVDYENRGNIGDVKEETQNFYGRLDFGNEFANGMSIDGNVGVRYTKSDVSGVGALVYNSLLSEQLRNGGEPTEGDLQIQSFVPEAIAYSERANLERSGKISSDDRWLPSLNVKWNVNDDFLVRFAASQAITRPRVEQLRGDQSTNVALTRVFDATVIPVPGESREPLDVFPTQVNVFGGNPDLKPIESTNLDLSFEYYYGDNNSLTMSLFTKDIKNNIIYGSQTIDTITLDGREVAVVYNGDVNQDKGDFKGVELAYQQFFDNAPGILSKLGVQANYTYIDAKTNAPLPIVDADGDGTPDSFEQIFRFGVDNFLGLSEHAANLIGIYQDDSLEVRLAYNWRSEYLSSYRDFVTGNPIFQDDRGFLDGSVKYDFNENFQIRAQIANILDTKSNASQQIDASGQRFGRTSFVGDRRIKVGARYAF